jgi:hypothetical protein
MDTCVLEVIQKLPLPDLNVKYSLFAEAENGEVDESYELAYKHNIPVILLLKTRCIITVQLMSHLFHGSACVGWKLIDINDINSYPYVSVIIQANDDYDETYANSKSHAFFLFKNADGITYKTESYYYGDKHSMATTQKFDKLPEIDTNYHYTVFAPEMTVEVDIESRVKDITSWVDDNVHTLSDEYAVLLQ